VSEAYWRLENHVCRRCLGRIVSRIAEDGQAIVRCSNCGFDAAGDPAAICCCGIKRGSFDKLRCVRLEKPLAGITAEVVATETESPIVRS
jgi:ribosomal protein L37AE/L43A